ncbi:M23 family metallopeptidase [Microbacterium hydrocarbonoxydans]|uniref:M23 family metallopeptidase n=1 Tax=Microbacterium hydrocarbonoxydans TaxID=273678 RepID=UPI003D9948AE
MLWPNGSTTRPPITSPFGRRTAPTPGASTIHRGTDFVGYDRIRAIAPGRVVRVGTPSGWAAGGVQVWIQHAGFLTRSMHMVKGSPTVKVGEEVDAGDDLGEMGATGNVSGKHHHLEVVIEGVQIDPVTFIADRLTAPASGGSTTRTEGFLMALSDYDQQLVKNAVVDINNRTADMAAAMAKSDAQVAALHALYAERDSNGWAWADIVKSHVVATLQELRAAGVASGGVDIDALTKRIVDEQAKRLAS